MAIVSDIEALCKRLNVDIPALHQLRLAASRNDSESVKRISANILEYIAENSEVDSLGNKENNSN